MVAEQNVRAFPDASPPDGDAGAAHDRGAWPSRRTMIDHAILAAPDLTWTEKGVYMALLTHCYAGKAVCWPAVSTLAAETNLTPRRIHAVVAALARKGWLSKESGGGRQSTHYTLLGPPAGATKRPRTPAHRSALNPCTSDRAPLKKAQGTPEETCVLTPALFSPEAVQEEAVQEKGYSASHEAGAVAPPARTQEPPPVPMPTKGPRPELPQYRVFLHLCRVVEADIADMDGKKGRACADAAKALKALTQRYADEGRAAPAEDAEADLCAMLTWKAGRMRAHRRDPAEALTVQAAYADMAAWRKAGGPGRPEQPPTVKVKTARELETERLMQLAYDRDVLGKPPAPAVHSPAVQAMLAAATQRAAALQQQKAAAW